MITLQTTDSSLLSLIILIIIFFNTYNRSEKVFLHYKLFIALVQINAAMIIVDLLGWIFNGLPGLLNLYLNTGFNILLYLTAPLGAVIWVCYTDYQVFRDDTRIKKLRTYLLIPWVINALLTALSLHNKWFFWVDAGNVYHRGHFYWIHTGICFGLLAYSFLFILINHKIIEKRYFFSLLLFFLPQVIGATIQTFRYGVSFIWSGMMLSLLIVYFNIQDRALNTDYLTGVYNKRQLDTYLKVKIRNCTEKTTFAAILIDLDEFKQINDNFGHHIGDEALRETAEVIRRSLRRNDFIARFGGDEFFIVMDLNSRPMLQLAIDRIKDCVEKFNKESHKPYQISFCMGYDLYDYNSKMKSDEFFEHIDRLMYRNKNRRNTGILKPI